MQISQQLSRSKAHRRASSRQRAIAALICLAVIVIFGLLHLVARYNIDLSWWLGYCGFKARTGLPCPTCGMTTSVLAFAQGKIAEAFYIQPAAAFLCSIMIVIGFFAFLTAAFGVYFRFFDRLLYEVRARYLILALVIIIAAGWAVTMTRALVAQHG